jgi:hypothetical protein
MEGFMRGRLSLKIDTTHATEHPVVRSTHLMRNPVVLVIEQREQHSAQLCVARCGQGASADMSLSLLLLLLQVFRYYTSGKNGFTLFEDGRIAQLVAGAGLER